MNGHDDSDIDKERQDEDDSEYSRLHDAETEEDTTSGGAPEEPE